MKIIKLNDFKLNENKMWYKTIPQIIDFLESHMKNSWIYLDTETTGLGGPVKQQLTQIAAISVDPNTNKKIDSFNQKIEIGDDFKDILDDKVPGGGWARSKVLKFNHYADNMEGKEYLPEQEVLELFFDWVSEQTNPLYVIQNAEFDMKMLSGRFKNKLNRVPIFDTKMFIQLYVIPLYQKLAEDDEIYVKKLEEIGTSTRDNGLIASSMGKWSIEFDVDASGYHDALFDCEMTNEMFVKMVDFLKKHKDLDIQKYQTERIKQIRLK